ncbi:MAG: hypothetical protein NTX81_04965 [Candidatus Bathyarchaeota archaeon]|nr:hypothetical protein [Candidatus Bathyarchaeota archaeon]
MAMEAIDGDSSHIDSARKAIIETLKDEILGILLRNSNLTKKQFESFLIGSLSPDFFDRGFASRGRPMLRTDRSSLSRGSFDSTLIQARKNITEAIYTILMLGYTGLLESPQLEPFLEVGNRLRSYSESRGNRITDQDHIASGVISDKLIEIVEEMIGRAKRKTV